MINQFMNHIQVLRFTYCIRRWRTGYQNKRVFIVYSQRSSKNLPIYYYRNNKNYSPIRKLILSFDDKKLFFKFYPRFTPETILILPPDLEYHYIISSAVYLAYFSRMVSFFLPIWNYVLAMWPANLYFF